MTELYSRYRERRAEDNSRTDGQKKSVGPKPNRLNERKIELFDHRQFQCLHLIVSNDRNNIQTRRKVFCCECNFLSAHRELTFENIHYYLSADIEQRDLNNAIVTNIEHH